MKQTIKFLAILAVIFTMTSCSDDDEDPKADPNVEFTTTLSGANEVPANESTATGTATATFNTETKVFTLTATHDIEAPTGGHIHKAAAGENGDVVFPFDNNGGISNIFNKDVNRSSRS